jgi:cyclopropane fatty-acyl-phospholipid synthase-like methyltransferase
MLSMIACRVEHIVFLRVALEAENVTDDTRFDTEQVFTSEHYYYFYPEDLLPEHIEEEVEVVWRALDLHPGLQVLDLACGNRRIANALAARLPHDWS